MTPIGKDILDRLLARGRERGYVTTEDLKNELPVGSMSPDDISLVVAHLEERGVAVELDDSLLAPGASQSGLPPNPQPSFELPPVPLEPTPVPPRGSDLHVSPAGAPAASEPPQGRRAAHGTVVVAGLVVLVVLILLVALIA